MDVRETLLGWIDTDRDTLVDVLCRFVQARSPNPPGDTRDAAAVVQGQLGIAALPYRVIAPAPAMPNIVASFDGSAPGRHLVLNGHMDVFPVDETETWQHPPWGGVVADGKIYGRGVVDMKAGTTASLFTYIYLSRLRAQLRGRLTLTCVSDEETFGPWGARYLMEHHPEVHGDCLLNGEPSSPYTIRFGEKGPMWLRFTVRTPGAHGAYTHLSASAIKIAAGLIHDLGIVQDIPAAIPAATLSRMREGAEALDHALGAGAHDVVERVTLNIGTIEGGLKVNVVPGRCSFEADIRLPPGLTREDVLPVIGQVLRRYPQAAMEELNGFPPSACDADGEMVGILRRNAQALAGIDPKPVISIGATDARLWRYAGVPAYVHGPFPRGMGQADECIEVDEFLHVVRMHVLSAYDYLVAD